jgi:hypothetical protein
MQENRPFSPPVGNEAMCCFRFGLPTPEVAGPRAPFLKTPGEPYSPSAPAAGALIDEVGFAATATLYATAGLALLMGIALNWRADLWHVHAPANAG